MRFVFPLYHRLPDRAITAPFQLDARLCISISPLSLKAQSRLNCARSSAIASTAVTIARRRARGNKFAVEGSLMKPHARHDLATPDLIELLQLDDGGFKTKFRGTPMLRTKRRGILRNVRSVGK